VIKCYLQCLQPQYTNWTVIYINIFGKL